MDAVGKSCINSWSLFPSSSSNGNLGSIPSIGERNIFCKSTGRTIYAFAGKSQPLEIDVERNTLRSLLLSSTSAFLMTTGPKRTKGYGAPKPDRVDNFTGYYHHCGFMDWRAMAEV